MANIQRSNILLPTEMKNCEDLVRKSLTIMVSELMAVCDRTPQELQNNKTYPSLVSATEQARLLLSKITVLLKWTNNVDIIHQCNDLIMRFNNNMDILNRIVATVSNIYFTLWGSFMPILPLNSALSVLNQAKYPFISAICDSKAPILSKLSKEEGKKLITRILRTRILTEEIPSFVTSIRVEDSVIICEEKDFFSISFTITKPALDTSMTITSMRIVNNNNTRMMVFPFFDSVQVSRIIGIINRSIAEDTSLPSIITTIYKMTHYIITKQILYVLYTQLVNLSDSCKRSYGISSISYSINLSSLSFKFWKNPRKRPAEETEVKELNEVCLQLENRNGLMCIVCRCSSLEYKIDLRHYRVFNILLDCIAWRRSEMLEDLANYLQSEIKSSQYIIKQHLDDCLLDQIDIRFGRTAVQLCCRIDLFTGLLQLSWNDNDITRWCTDSLQSIHTCIESRLPLLSALDRQYQYCLLSTVNSLFSTVNKKYRFVLTHINELPALQLSCHIDQDIKQRALIQWYQIVVTLQADEPGSLPHSVSFSTTTAESLLRRGGSAYHSINNKMEGLNMMETEVGFDIDGERGMQGSSDSEFDSPTWAILISAQRVTSGVKSIITPYDSLQRVVQCEDPSSLIFRDKLCYSIQKLLPRLRFASLHDTMCRLSEMNQITEVRENKSQCTVTCLLNRVSSQVTIHVEDDEGMKVAHHADQTHEPFTRSVPLTKGYTQTVNISHNNAIYTLPSNTPPYQFFNIEYYHIQLLSVQKTLQAYLAKLELPITLTHDVSLPSFFTTLIRYSFTDMTRSSPPQWIAITHTPATSCYVTSSNNSAALMGHMMRYVPLSVSLFSRSFQYYRAILLTILMQYVYDETINGLKSKGISPDSTIVFFTISLSRMELRLRFGESMSITLIFDFKRVRILPKDAIASAFLKKIQNGDIEWIEKDYKEVSTFIVDLILSRQQG